MTEILPIDNLRGDGVSATAKKALECEEFVPISSTFRRFAAGGVEGIDREADEIPKGVREDVLVLLERVLMGVGAPTFPGLV